MKLTTLPTSRAELVGYLQNITASNALRYEEEQKLEEGTGLLKSYLMEIDDYEAVIKGKILEKLLTESNYELSRTDDPALHIIKNETDTSEIYFLDTIDKRFWTFYTTTPSGQADRLISRLGQSPKVDHVWFTMRILHKVSKMGMLKGFSVRFDDSSFNNADLNMNTSSLSIKAWGNRTQEVLSTLQGADQSNILNLSGVRVRYVKDREVNAYNIEDVSYHGKITTFGNSVRSHMDFVDNVLYKNYKPTVELFEKQNRFAFKNKTLVGQPIYISLKREIPDLKLFATNIFSGKKPFRLFGFHEIKGKKYRRIQAIDLHVGDKLSFEIFNKTIRIILEENACGNNVLRFLTLLQQHFDPSAKLEGYE